MSSCPPLRPRPRPSQLTTILFGWHRPAGLAFTDDDELHKLLGDLEAWKSNLPADLQFRGPETPMNAGEWPSFCLFVGFRRRVTIRHGLLSSVYALCRVRVAEQPAEYRRRGRWVGALLTKLFGGLGMLFLFYTTVNMIFWRVFMRISYSCPAHLKFSLTVEKWTGLVQMSGDAIDWLDAHEEMYDVWLLVPYCATSFALVQVRVQSLLIVVAVEYNLFMSPAVPYLCAKAGPGCPAEAEEAPRLRAQVGSIALA